VGLFASDYGEAAILGAMNRFGDETCLHHISICQSEWQVFRVFHAIKGISQGDPLSLYLFSLCSKGLSCLIKYSEPHYLSRGIRVVVDALWSSHLLFVNDCLVLVQASTSGASRLHNIVEQYREGSGKLVNRHKSAVFSSSNCTDDMNGEVHTLSGVDVEARKILGFTNCIGSVDG
jgi:hypothetical protein